MAKHASARRVKLHRSYTYDEAAKLLGVHKRTVATWVKDKGLEAVTDQRPHLILGADLKAFLERQKKPKAKCAAHQLYCFTCRAPRDPADNALEYRQRNATQGQLKARCIQCGTTMHKGANRAILAAIGAQYTVTITKADQRLSDSADTL